MYCGNTNRSFSHWLPAGCNDITKSYSKIDAPYGIVCKITNFYSKIDISLIIRCLSGDPNGIKYLKITVKLIKLRDFTVKKKSSRIPYLFSAGGGYPEIPDN